LGGGVFCGGNNTVIFHNIISHNVCGGQYCHGGGICCASSIYTVISYNTITYNSALQADGFGGGIYCGDGGTVSSIDHNLISYNSAIKAGGIYCGEGSVFEQGGNTEISSISYDTISNNSSNTDGGGIWCGSMNSGISNIDTISNIIIINNTAAAGNGGGFYCSGTSPAMLNVTIANNYANQYGGGLYCDVSAKPNLYNCILWSDSAVAAGGGNEMFQNDNLSVPSFYYCDVKGGQVAFGLGPNFYTGIYNNNINFTPLFISPSASYGIAYNGVTANWGLQTGSPCIDAGAPLAPNAPYSSYPSQDLAGNPRLVICRIDIGAYENQYGISSPLKLNFSGASSICLHDSTTLTAGGATTYSWNPSVGLSSATVANPFAKPTVTTTYTVIGTSGTCEAIDTIRLTVNLLPSIIISGTDTIFPGSRDTLTATGASSFIWSTTGTNDTAIVTPNTKTTYTVTGTTAGCKATATFTVNISTETGIKNISSSINGEVYPNPSNSTVSLKFKLTGATSMEANMKVMDMNGRDVMNLNQIINADQIVSLDISSLPTGIYFVKVASSTMSQLVKFVKE
jgi:hypothetical protein